MSATDLLAAVGSATAAGAAGITIWRVVVPWTRTKRERAAGIDHLLHGKPDVLDEQRKVIEPGHSAITVQLNELHELVSKQLTPNGGSSIADRVTRIDRVVSDLRVHQQDIEAAVKAESVQTDEARVLAGRAATTADRVDQRHTDDIAQIDAKIDAITGMVEETRLIVSAQLQEAELRAEAMRNIAIELGMPWPEE